ncbi:hypothetical protein RF11_04553 [Thelohanellus kitauei]|uniref:Uncharacterized protein n=1 Tax=Thelohanellus kitauei TaxID=669202 RepID=A0A0C2N1C3_THEKT|nr:hypothetical protein RF11_04553 [Thelohanellus kitauei]
MPMTSDNFHRSQSIRCHKKYELIYIFEDIQMNIIHTFLKKNDSIRYFYVHVTGVFILEEIRLHHNGDIMIEPDPTEINWTTYIFSSTLSQYLNYIQARLKKKLCANGYQNGASLWVFFDLFHGDCLVNRSDKISHHFKAVEPLNCHFCSSRISWDFCQAGSFVECPDYMDACATGLVNSFQQESEFAQLYLRQCLPRQQCNKNSPLCDGNVECVLIGDKLGKLKLIDGADQIFQLEKSTDEGSKGLGLSDAICKPTDCLALMKICDIQGNKISEVKKAEISKVEVINYYKKEIDEENKTTEATVAKSKIDAEKPQLLEQLMSTNKIFQVKVTNLATNDPPHPVAEQTQDDPDVQSEAVVVNDTKGTQADEYDVKAGDKINVIDEDYEG